jgi:hypothetical protein
MVIKGVIIKEVYCIKNRPVFSFIYFDYFLGIIFHWTSQLCKMSVNWSNPKP